MIAQYNLGVQYKNGQGIVRDLSKAIFWCQKAADQGYDRAKQLLLGEQEEKKLELIIGLF